MTQWRLDYSPCIILLPPSCLGLSFIKSEKVLKSYLKRYDWLQLHEVFLYMPHLSPVSSARPTWLSILSLIELRDYWLKGAQCKPTREEEESGPLISVSLLSIMSKFWQISKSGLLKRHVILPNTKKEKTEL